MRLGGCHHNVTEIAGYLRAFLGPDGVRVGEASMRLLARPWLVKARNRVRHIPGARAFYKRWTGNRDYEERFARELLEAVGPGDVVWDVGANVGVYTAQFIARGAGRVVCFEPAPQAVSALRARFASDPRSESKVTILPIALSDANGTAPMAIDGAAPTNQLKVGAQPSADLVEVRVARGDEIAREIRLPAPQVLKVDVEGYELEVLRGLGRLLHAETLRAAFVEVHFGLLHERGLDAAPSMICSLLESAGFKVRWLDLSHVAGARS